MFLRGSFLCVFFLAINVDRPEQYADLLRNLQAVYRRFCQEQGLARAFCANSALYARPANALPSMVFSEVVDLASGDVVQLVRTLPCHSISSISLVISITCFDSDSKRTVTKSISVPILYDLGKERKRLDELSQLAHRVCLLANQDSKAFVLFQSHSVGPWERVHALQCHLKVFQHIGTGSGNRLRSANVTLRQARHYPRATYPRATSANSRNVAVAPRRRNEGYLSTCVCSSFRTRDITVTEVSGGSSDSPSFAAARALADWPAAR